jgi:hypothetical protein
MEDLPRLAESLRSRLDGLETETPLERFAVAEMGALVFAVLRAGGHEAFELPMSDDQRMTLMRRASQERFDAIASKVHSSSERQTVV